MRRGAALLAATVAALALAGCAGDGGGEEDAGNGAATVEAIAGSDLSRVTLTDDAARRIDLHAEAVVTDPAGEGTEIPYGAVLYDPQGRTWAYVKGDGLSFVRAPITIARIDGGVAFLTAGPPVGTAVVSVGAPELYGAEIGVGDE